MAVMESTSSCFFKKIALALHDSYGTDSHEGVAMALGQSHTIKILKFL